MVMLNPGLLLRFCRALHNPCKGALSRRHRLLLQSQESARRGWLHLRGKSIQLMLPLAQMLKVRAERSLVLPHLRWKWNSLVLHDTVVADRTSMCTTILFSFILPVQGEQVEANLERWPRLADAAALSYFRQAAQRWKTSCNQTGPECYDPGAELAESQPAGSSSFRLCHRCPLE